MRFAATAIKKYLPLAALILLLAIAYAAGVMDHLNLETLQAHKAEFQDYVGQHPLSAIFVFTALYILAVALSLPIATLLTLLGGFLFGKWLGTLIVVTSATIGACILFLAARSALGEILRKKAGKLYHRIETNMQENAIGYMLFMRLIPLFPFFLVNIVPALFNVSLRAFALTTFFGIIPGSFVYVNLGQELSDITSLHDLVSRDTLFAFALLGVMAITPTLYKQYKTKKNTA